ncbi:MAG: DNA repair protein RadA [bacterium]|nr:MAG: DNA repair protein RadA [bacterium]
MKKVKTAYVCRNCGSHQPGWVGKCPDCGEWNSMVEEILKKEPSLRRPVFAGESKPSRIIDLPDQSGGRLATGMDEMDRVLGGGIVEGSMVLIGGDPGIGKSTLLLQLSGNIAMDETVLYVTGEESPRQIKIRAKRLGINPPSLLVYPETNIEMITAQIKAVLPKLVVIDSIQTVYTELMPAAPGSVGQLRESTAILTQTAKHLNVPVFLVGHVTKEGAIAGPRVLEHMVDTVLYLEGDRDHHFRVLRSVKNRFGSAQEIGVFEMREGGLAEVKNPSEIFILPRAAAVSGSIITCAISGTRPILVELQALVTPTSFGHPRRTAVGLDYNRVVLMAAILQKRAGLSLDSEDIYVSAAGGVRVDDPGSDLALAAALTGSFRNIMLEKNSVFMGEVGLGGELRPVSSLHMRLKEAARMGMARAIIPSLSPDEALSGKHGGMEILTMDHVGNLTDFL